MNFKEHYYDEKKQFITEVTQLLIEEKIDNSFVVKLTNYLEKIFPIYGDFDKLAGNEIRKYLSGSDEKKIKQTKDKVYKILIKAKNKFLMSVRDKVSNLEVNSKAKVEQNNGVPSNIIPPEEHNPYILKRDIPQGESDVQ